MEERDYDFKIICLETNAFHSLIDQVLERVSSQSKQPDKWINDKEAMQMLRISSTTTLQKYRDQGSIRFSQPSRKVILYDRDSILKFLDKHAKDTF
jgi:hypothetical protein